MKITPSTLRFTLFILIVQILLLGVQIYYMDFAILDHDYYTLITIVTSLWALLNIYLLYYLKTYLKLYYFNKTILLLTNCIIGTAFVNFLLGLSFIFTSLDYNLWGLSNYYFLIGKICSTFSMALWTLFCIYILFFVRPTYSYLVNLFAISQFPWMVSSILYFYFNEFYLSQNILPKTLHIIGFIPSIVVFILYRNELIKNTLHTESKS